MRLKMKMKINKNINSIHLKKAIAFMQVSVLMVASMLPIGVNAAQLNDRSVTVSSSVAGATNVTYRYAYKVNTADEDLGSFKVEVCSNDPFPGTSCTAPAGFSGASIAAGNTTVEVGGASQTVDTVTTSGSADNIIDVTLTTAVSAVAAGTEVIITFSSAVTNPSSSNTQYFSRVYTYSDTGNATLVDDGGLAFSTAESIDVTARVQETLTFCVYATGATCGSPGDTTVDLGVLTTSPSGTDNKGSHQAEVATNALNGYVIQYAGTTLTHSNDTNTIEAIGATGEAQLTDGSAEQFGLNIAVNSGSGSTLDADYSGTNYAFVDGATITDGTDTAATNAIANSTEPVSTNVFDLEFLGSITNLTATGTYSTTVTYVATATF